jgi:hypothetical protein
VPLSDRPEARERQLANLKRGQNPAPRENRFNVLHGGYAAVLADTLDAKVGVIFDALSEDAPLSEGSELPRADTVVVRLLAECLCRLDSVSADLRDHGWQDRRSGAPRPAVELVGRLRREAADYLDALGMTPRSRGRLGVDLGRVAGLDASTILALARGEADPEVRRALLRRAGLLDEESPDG